MDLSPTGLYKVLNLDGMPYHGGRGRAYQVGKKRSVRGELVACANGIHVCRADQLVRWLGPAIYPVTDVSNEQINADDKTVVRWVVLGEPRDTWTEQTARLFAADCAERVLSLFEREHPTDSRPREAIETARRFGRGAALREDLAAAWDAAGDAAGAAERAWQTERLFQYLRGEIS